MNKLVLILVFFAISNTSFAQKLKKEFVVSGKLQKQDDGLLYLHYTNRENKRVKDSSVLKKGMFSFKGSISEPTMAYLQLKEDKRNELNSFNFFIEPAVINMTVEVNNFKNAKISGSATQKQYENLNKLKEPIRKQMQPVLDEYTAANEAYMTAVKKKLADSTLDELKEKAADVRDKFTPYNKKQDQIDKKFFAANPKSYVTAYMLRFYVSKLSLDSLQMYYNRFGKTLQKARLGKEIAEEIRKLSDGSPGSMAKDFTATDIKGNKLSLSDYKGKYVLVDFWASWCVPCRKGNPHLKQLYAKYKEKGIEFIGIADDDRAEEAWKKAVEKDGIGIWKHVRRGLKYTNGEYDRSTDISEKFGIHTLPTKILIDREGKIIGRYGEEEDMLDKKLAEIFDR